ncbi:hypothetical protein MYX64_06060 [Nitrospinae bacterium AH_259_B05_G02_I21]|nr:hypothetical protein [Nitrospinae bacterium AH_259_B05_G02_I21]MDA2931784.1 hypothetical protein [Nitrospinae bacterium AH-259-F20]
MELHRYDIIDEYTLEELQRKYRASDAKGRINILESYYKRDRQALYEIALLAVEDSNVEVRQWIARHGKSLDYGDDEPEYQYPERNLEERLKNDPDPFVRACLRENPYVFYSIHYTSKWTEWFKEGTHLERLALVRNPEVDPELIEKVFDPEDEELGIELEARKELALAFITNTSAQSKSSLDSSDHVDGYSWYLTQKHYSLLWKYTSKWPIETGVPYAVYRYLNADDGMKAEAYKACDNKRLRYAILENCDPNDTATLSLGMKDSDDTCRYIAYSNIRYPTSEVIQETLKSKDTWALHGLAYNQTLSMDNLIKVRDRLSELDDDIGASQAAMTIEQIQEKQTPKDPEELFGYEGREGDFIEDKIDFIGKRLIDFEDFKEELTDRLLVIEQIVQQVASKLSALRIFLAIALGVALLVWIFK